MPMDGIEASRKTGGGAVAYTCYFSIKICFACSESSSEPSSDDNVSPIILVDDYSVAVLARAAREGRRRTREIPRGEAPDRRT